ncbi:MAG TPA: class I SAM-dependent methyltransferase [Thermomicrobiales bacterium]|nr:class I SAM-dependent methyltransferase [Thermomicrobiales bacterium]
MTDRSTGCSYDVNDPGKIQGRDEIRPGVQNLASIRLDRALHALRDVRGSILLPGAGAGRYARALARARPDLTIVGGDISGVATHEAVAAGGGPAYLVLDAEAIPLRASTFGAVVFFDLLEHVPYPPRMLAESFRVLCPGGVLHFFVPLEDQPRTLYRALRRDRPIPIHRWKRDHVGHVQRFDRDAVAALVTRAGFTVVDKAHSFHIVGQTHDIVDYWQREREGGGRGRLPVAAVRLIARGVFVVTWRLSYLEDRVLRGPAFASGLHLTARKPAENTPAQSSRPEQTR